MKAVAYFCLEYAVEDDLPIYAGGLGVLAGDLLLEAGQQGLDWTGVGLLYGQKNPESFGFKKLTALSLASVWEKKYGSARLFLLEAAPVTDRLYGPDDLTMLKQQIVLGFGGVELFKFLDFKPDVFHLNEGHTAMVILALACDFAKDNPGMSLKFALESVKPRIVSTKHTILPGAGLHLPWELVKKHLGPILESHGFNFADLISVSRHKGDPGLFSTTQLLLNFSSKTTAVSAPHAQFEKAIHPDSPLIPITNGVNQKRWQSLKSKANVKKELNLDSKALVIVWARRLAAYKRPQLLFSNFTRLEKIVNIPNRPVQIIIAGRAVDESVKFPPMTSSLTQKVFILSQYDLELAKKLTAAADVWLNTPMPGQEASGTSGMKAGLNGALQLSTADGWIVEQNWQDLGWILFEENINTNLYTVIEKEIIPLYFENPREWEKRAQKTRELVEQKYTTARVLNNYFEKLYD